MYIHSGVSATDISVAGSAQVYSDVSYVHVQSGGIVNVYGSNITNSTVEYGGLLLLRPNGRLPDGDLQFTQDVTDDSGYIVDARYTLTKTTTASGITVMSGGVEVIGGPDFGDDHGGSVSSSAIDNGTQIFSGGQQYVSSYGTAISAHIQGGALQTILDGGLALYSDVQGGGRLVVSSGGTASGSVLSSGGTLSVENLGLVSGVRAGIGPSGSSTGTLSVLAGGTAIDVSLATTSVSVAGQLSLVSGNVVGGVSIGSSAYVLVNSGAVISGETAVAATGILTVAAGGRV